MEKRMELINIVLIIIVLLCTIAPVLFILNLRKRITRKIDINNIKFYLEEYLKEFNICQSLELNTKLKIEDNNTPPIKHPLLLVIFICIPFCVLRCYKPKFESFEKSLENIIIIAGIGFLFCIVTALIIFFLTKRATTKQIILRNNIIEVNNINKTKTYQLSICNIKYDLQTIYNSRGPHRYIDIYFNNDKFSSKGYNIYDFEFYIAFILFVNLLKINDIEKIKNLTNNDIEKLQQNYIYNAENLSSVGE